MNAKRKVSYTTETRTVTYTCLECGQTVTESRYPGRLPKYCPGCAPVVKRRQARERMRRFRARQDTD